jgi:hypothetical protein
VKEVDKQLRQKKEKKEGEEEEGRLHPWVLPRLPLSLFPDQRSPLEQRLLQVVVLMTMGPLLLLLLLLLLFLFLSLMPTKSLLLLLE